MSMVESSAKRAGVTPSHLLSSILEKFFINGSEVEDTDTLIAAMDALTEFADGVEKSGDKFRSMSERLRAASFGLEVIASIDTSDHKSEAMKLSLLMDVLELIRKGTGYSSLPTTPNFKRKDHIS